MTLLGKTGLEKVALLSAEKAQDVAKKIVEIEGFEPYFKGPFVREFAIKTPVPAQKVILAMLEHQVLCGVNAGRWFDGMDDCLIVALTEKRTSEEIEQLINGLKEVARSGVLSGM
jgi:glycine dehydrogenase subunit 1